MRIESTDAANVTFLRLQEPKMSVKENKTNLQTTNMAAENIKNSQPTELEKKELPIAERVVIDAIEKANKAILGPNRRFEFSIHDKTKEIVVKVIDSETNEVIREIPPEKILDMVAKLWEIAGIIIDERR